ncbi:MAG: hypothetical protein H6855_00790 [Rhodospirillales bacterium]|nr:hypothetical protein [Rhodospirillales bacterium]MCB9964605.1 hypothetical protein [Rhodospirillales bacterium]
MENIISQETSRHTATGGLGAAVVGSVLHVVGIATNEPALQHMGQVSGLVGTFAWVTALFNANLSYGLPDEEAEPEPSSVPGVSHVGHRVKAAVCAFCLAVSGVAVAARTAPDELVDLLSLPGQTPVFMGIEQEPSEVPAPGR